LWLITDRLDLDAELVALAYRYRWTVELFFRWLKCILGCRHLISNSQNGVTIQLYVALIASLLIALITGRKPTKRTLEMIQFYLGGGSRWADLEPHLRASKSAARPPPPVRCSQICAPRRQPLPAALPWPANPVTIPVAPSNSQPTPNILSSSPPP